MYHEGEIVGFCTNRHYVQWWASVHHDGSYDAGIYESPEARYKGSVSVRKGSFLDDRHNRLRNASLLLMNKTQVACSNDFIEAYFRLPNNVQKKVRSLMARLLRDPTQAAAYFERLACGVDPNIRIARIDAVHRAIVVCPPRGDLYLCVWVDQQNEAFQWVQNRKFVVYLRSGLLQIETAEETDGTGPNESIDVDDLEAFTPRPESLEQFKIIVDEAELNAMLATPVRNGI